MGLAQCRGQQCCSLAHQTDEPLPHQRFMSETILLFNLDRDYIVQYAIDKKIILKIRFVEPL